MIRALLILLSTQAASFSIPSSCSSYATQAKSLSACSTASAFCSTRLKGSVQFTSTVFATSTSTITKDVSKTTTSTIKSTSFLTSEVTTVSTATQIDILLQTSLTTLLTTDIETSTHLLVSTLTETSVTTQSSTEYTEIPSTTVYPLIVVTLGTTTIFEPTPTIEVEATTTITTTQSACLGSSKNRRRAAVSGSLVAQASCGISSLNAAQISHACVCYQALYPSLTTSVISKATTTTVFKTATTLKTVQVIRTTVLTTTAYTTSTEENIQHIPTTVFLPTTEIETVSLLSTVLDWQTSVLDIYFTSTANGPGITLPTTMTVPSTTIITPATVTITTATITAHDCTTPPACTPSPGINLVANPGFEESSGLNSTSSPDWTTSSNTSAGAVYFPNQPANAKYGNYYAELLVSTNGGTTMLNQTLSGLDTTQYYIFNASYSPQGQYAVYRSDYCTLAVFLGDVTVYQRRRITSTAPPYEPFLGSVQPDASTAELSIQLWCQTKLHPSASINVDDVILAQPDLSCATYIQVAPTGTLLDGLFVQWQYGGDLSYHFTADPSSATLVSLDPSGNLISNPPPGTPYGFWISTDTQGGVVTSLGLTDISSRGITALACAVDPVDLEVSCNDGYGNTVFGYTVENGVSQLVLASANSTSEDGLAWTPVTLQAVASS